MKLDVPMFHCCSHCYGKVATCTNIRKPPVDFETDKGALRIFSESCGTIYCLLTNLYPSLLYCCINLLCSINQISGDQSAVASSQTHSDAGDKCIGTSMIIHLLLSAVSILPGGNDNNW